MGKCFHFREHCKRYWLCRKIVQTKVAQNSISYQKFSGSGAPVVQKMVNITWPMDGCFEFLCCFFLDHFPQFTRCFILDVQKWIHVLSLVTIHLKNSFPLAKYRVKNCNAPTIRALRLSFIKCQGTYRVHTFLICRWFVTMVQCVLWPASCRKCIAIWVCVSVMVH